MSIKQWTPIQGTNFMVSNAWTLLNAKPKPDKSLSLFIKPRVLSFPDQLVPLLSGLYLYPQTPPGAIWSLSPWVIQSTLGGQTRSIQSLFVSITPAGGVSNVNAIQNFFWDCAQPFYLEPRTQDKKGFMMTFSIDLEQNGFELSPYDHLLIKGSFPQFFQVLMNPANLLLQSRRFTYWGSEPLPSSHFVPELGRWKEVAQQLKTHRVGLLGNRAQRVGHWTIPEHSPKSGIYASWKTLPNCGYLIHICATCMEGSIYLQLTNQQKKRIIHPQFQTRWEAGETAEFILFFPELHTKGETVELGLVSPDVGTTTEFVLHECRFLQLTPALFGNPWEMPSILHQEYQENTNDLQKNQRVAIVLHHFSSFQEWKGKKSDREEVYWFVYLPNPGDQEELDAWMQTFQENLAVLEQTMTHCFLLYDRARFQDLQIQHQSLLRVSFIPIEGVGIPTGLEDVERMGQELMTKRMLKGTVLSSWVNTRIPTQWEDIYKNRLILVSKIGNE